VLHLEKVQASRPIIVLCGRKSEVVLLYVDLVKGVHI
jgi:hypothetical protein